MTISVLTHKPWGTETLLENNPSYSVKKLVMLKGCSCSLQYHELKLETIYVLEGQLNLEINNEVVTLSPGVCETIKPNTLHRMSAVDSDVVYLECSTSHLDDVVRVQDNYGRV